MKRLAWAVTALLFCLVTAGAARVVQNQKAAEAEILKLQNDWLAAEARGDMRVLDRLVSNDFVGLSFAGGVLNKKDIIPADGSTGERLWGKSSVKEPTVRLFGDTAVVMGRIEREEPGAVGFRFCMVYQKGSRGWQMIAAHLAR